MFSQGKTQFMKLGEIVMLQERIGVVPPDA
jgi:hypothetical protein